MAKAYDVMLVGGSSPGLHGIRGAWGPQHRHRRVPDGRVVSQDQVHLTAWEAVTLLVST